MAASKRKALIGLHCLLVLPALLQEQEPLLLPVQMQELMLNRVLLPVRHMLYHLL